MTAPQEDRFVLDGSVTMAWCFEDESSEYADAVLQRLATTEALVPSLWPLEVANVVLVGERRGRITRADSAQFLSLLSTLPIHIDQDTPHRAFAEVLTLGRDQGLTSYDAAYLDLAMREGLGLATTDTRLRDAAAALGVPLV